MTNATAKSMNLDHVPSPSYVIDHEAIERNLRLLQSVQNRTGAKILLALKGFAMFRIFPLARQHLHGTTASSVHEARLGKEEFCGEVHAYAPAYSEEDIQELSGIVDHLVFNSVAQLNRFGSKLRAATRGISLGLRINPEYSEVEVPLYDPCRKGSRLGITAKDLPDTAFNDIEGLHFHTLCEQNSDTLERTLEVVIKKFGNHFDKLKWINFGGGHHITRADYDIDRLCRIISDFQSQFDLQVYLEPGEAIGLNTGVLVATVLDIVENNGAIAILDVSATAHMPDVLEMPYRPVIQGAKDPGVARHTYTLGGLSCLAGDEIGAYSFDTPLNIGDKLVFEDMAHYTMVKNTTFNGVKLPSICLYHPSENRIEIVREFGYLDYRNRLS